MDLAEVFAKFMRLDIDDRARREVRSYEDLDRPLSPSRAPPYASSRRARGPFPFHARIEDLPGGGLRIVVPRPWKNQLAVGGFLFGFALVLFSIPVVVLDRIITGAVTRGAFVTSLLPLALIAAVTTQLGLGYSSEIEATPQRFLAITRGLVLRRRVFIPAPELEALHIEAGDVGGPMGMIDGFVVARSDRATVGFGHGLGRDDLENLVYRLRSILTARPLSHTPAVRPVVLRRAWVPVQWAYLVTVVGALAFLPNWRAGVQLLVKSGGTALEVWMAAAGLACAVAAGGGIVLSMLLRFRRRRG